MRKVLFQRVVEDPLLVGHGGNELDDHPLGFFWVFDLATLHISLEVEGVEGVPLFIEGVSSSPEISSLQVASVSNHSVNQLASKGVF